MPTLYGEVGNDALYSGTKKDILLGNSGGDDYLNNVGFNSTGRFEKDIVTLFWELLPPLPIMSPSSITALVQPK